MCYTCIAVQAFKTRELLIADCFRAWIAKDGAGFRAGFSTEAVYTESWGPAYLGLAEITKWFDDWNAQNRVLQWDIKRFWHDGNICICEWHFKCECGKVVDGFDGMSIIEFDDENRIARLKEFQSKTPNHYPYGHGVNT